MATNHGIRNPKAVWNKATDRILIEEILSQCHKGKKLDNGFKTEVWQQILIDFNTRRDLEEAFNLRQIKNRATLVSHF